MAKKTSDLEVSKLRIAKAKEKYADILKVKEELYPNPDLSKFDPDLYGERVHTLRTLSKRTLAQYAEEMGATSANLADIVNGKNKNINKDFMYLICAISNTTPDYLLGITDSPTESKSADSDGEQVCYEPIKFSLADRGKLLVEIEANYATYPVLCDCFVRILTADQNKPREDAQKLLDAVCAYYHI